MALRGGGGGGAPPLRPPWDPLLTRSDLLRGQAYYGSGDRLQAVAAKLLAGQEIKVYAIGGSVTKGSGSSDAATTSFPARLFQVGAAGCRALGAWLCGWRVLRQSTAVVGATAALP